MEQTADPRDTNTSLALAVDLALSAQQICELPLRVCAGWWAAGFQAAQPFMPHLHVAANHHAEDEQLVVPEPIESTGERALFA